MAIEWSPRQQKAIDERHKDLLVSAAAGSGKTTVLIERIKNLLIDENADIDRFLVVTFTKAAAAEMKDKLAGSLREEIRKGGPNAAALKKQLNLLPMADISTFDSFALKLDRENFQLLDLDPGVNIADGGQARLMAQDAMEETFRLLFDEDDPDFLAFLDRYSSDRSEEALQDSLLATYNKLRSFPDYRQWLREAVERLEKIQQNPAIYDEEILREMGYQIEQARGLFRESQRILDEFHLTGLSEKVQEDLDSIDEILAAKDLAGLSAGVAGFQAKTMTATKEEKESGMVDEATARYKPIREEGKDILKKLRDTYCGIDRDKEYARIAGTAPYAAMIEKILIKFEEQYMLVKQEKGVIDFADIEQYAIRALKDPSVASVYRNKFDYIFVDEYQDSNYLQEAILTAIARPDNLFMVGDIKQSIYGFRLAEPEIFRDKYHRYLAPEEAGMAIDLNENYRSKRHVIETVNRLFSRIMEDYNEDAALHQGLTSEEDVNYKVQLDVIHTDLADPEDLDPEILDMKAQEFEAYRVAEVVKQYLGRPYYDSKAKKLRKLGLRDIVILMNSVKSAGPVFKEVLAEAGLDSYVEEREGFFDAIEIATFMDLLRVIDNPRRDVPLLSALRSFLLHFTIEDLTAVRLHTLEGPFYDAFTAYGEDGPDEELRARVRETLARLESWRSRSRYLPIDSFLWMLLQETGYEAYMGALPGGTQRIANLRALVDRAVSLRSGGDVKMYDFLRFVDALSNGKGVDIGPARTLGEAEDVIRIMTIHKSKGLEFPVVILCGTGKRFNTQNETTHWLMHRDIGLGLEYIDLENRLKADTLPYTLINDRARRREREESIRVLYVAMTRAKDVLHIIGTMKGTRPERSFLRMILPVFEESPKDSLEVTHMNAADVYGRAGVGGSIGKTVDEAAPDEALRERIDRILSFEYPGTMTRVKSKYSVSELNRPEEAGMPTLDVPGFLARSEQPKLTGASIGTVYHTVLEHLDFALGVAKVKEGEEACARWVEEQILDLTGREILQPYEAEILDPALLVGFLKEDLTARMAACPVHKETPFTIYHEVEGQEVLVQGIIDCWFEEGEDLVLLDYKSNQSEENIQETYRTQMDLYRKALEQLTGKRVKEAWLYLLRHGKLVPM